MCGGLGNAMWLDLDLLRGTACDDGEGSGYTGTKRLRVPGTLHTAMANSSVVCRILVQCV
jgi:hypothetical protein